MPAIAFSSELQVLPPSVESAAESAPSAWPVARVRIYGDASATVTLAGASGADEAEVCRRNGAQAQEALRRRERTSRGGRPALDARVEALRRGGRAERALGWKARPLAEGIDATLADLRALGLLE